MYQKKRQRMTRFFFQLLRSCKGLLFQITSIAYLGLLSVPASFQRLIIPLSVEQLHWSTLLHFLKAGTRFIKQRQKTKHRRMATIILSVISCGQNIYWFEGSDEGIEGQPCKEFTRAKQKGNHARTMKANRVQLCM